MPASSSHGVSFASTSSRGSCAGMSGPRCATGTYAAWPGSTENDRPTICARIGSSDVVSVSNAVSSAAEIFASHASNCSHVCTVA
ncbi:hypothetical protein DP43_5608 [Burkholderia pseudomallei]|nr:hypothetical protein DP43_5608 [Burkholderia pseudomallei]